MKAEIKFECKNCIEDLTLDITITKSFPTMGVVREKAMRRGWSIGRDCYCPDCLSKLPARCKTCEHFEGNMIMGSSICRKDGKFTTENDYCPCHELRYGYKNPIPTID